MRGTRLVGAATTGLLLVVGLAGCVFPSGGSSEDPYLVLGDPDVSGLEDWPGAFDSEFATYDFDGDGRKELIAQSTDKSIYVFDTRSGRALAEIKSKYPPSWYIDQVSNGVQVGVLEPGQSPSIVAANHAGYVGAWRFVADESDDRSFAFERLWEVRPAKCEKNPSMDATAQLADVDGDGTLEVFVQAEEVGLYAFKSDGSLLWSQCWGGGNGSPVIDDLDGNGRLEAIFASDAGQIAVLNGATGDPIWTFDASHYVKPASISVAPTVAELDGAAPKEVLFTARHAPRDDPDAFDDFHMGIFAVHQKPGAWEGELVWRLQPEWANPLSYTPLVAEDVDGDGRTDIFGMDWNTIGHRPGDWERLGPGHAFRLSADGEVVWHREVDAWWSNKAVTIGDIDGDGGRELVVNGPRGTGDGFYGLSLETGQPRVHHAASGWKVMGGAHFLSLTDDGGTRLAYRVMPDSAEDDDKGPGAIIVHKVGESA